LDEFLNGETAGAATVMTKLASKAQLQILNRLALAPFRNVLRVDPKIPAQRRERSLRSLYCNSDGVRGRGVSRCP